jgi:hypothetical protein
LSSSSAAATCSCRSSFCPSACSRSATVGIAAVRCSHHGEVLAGSSAPTLLASIGVPIAHIRALDRCRAAGRVFASSARVLTQRLLLSPRLRFDGGGQLRAPSPEPVELVERPDRVAARGHEIDSRREASVACATSLRLSGGAPTTPAPGRTLLAEASAALGLSDPQGTLREHHTGRARPRAVTRLRAIPSSCAAFVPAASRSYPRLPARCSMVRRGSTVRVRQRASRKCLQIARLACPGS